jgi:hypothetical protein
VLALSEHLMGQPPRRLTWWERIRLLLAGFDPDLIDVWRLVALHHAPELSEQNSVLTVLALRTEEYPPELLDDARELAHRGAWRDALLHIQRHHIAALERAEPVRKETH